MSWKFIALAVAIGCGAAQACAQEAVPQTHATKLIAQNVRFVMVSGRIIAVVAQRSPVNDKAINLSGPLERLHIDAGFRGPNLSYSLKKGEEEFGVTVRAGTEISLRETRPAGAKGLSFQLQQLPGEPILLLVTEGNKQRTVRASTIWNLLLMEPELGRQQFIPLLEMLRPDWNLASNVAALEESLFHRAASDHSPNHRQLSRLVEQLASNKFSERHRAERELRAAGHVVLPFLEGLDRTRLDAEQWERVRNLIDDLEDDREDKVDRMAVWLAGHEQTWLALMSNDEEWKRRAAGEQLAALVGEKIDFNPAADANTRHKQIERLSDLFDRPAGISAKIPAEATDDLDDDSQ